MLSTVTDKHCSHRTHTEQTPPGAPLQCINQLGEEWGWHRPKGGPQHIHHRRNKNSHYEATELLNTLTYEARKPSLHTKYTWQHCRSLLLWTWCLIVRMCALWQCYMPQRFITRHTNGLPGFILQLWESALPQNNILPRTTSAQSCRRRPDRLLHMHSSANEKHSHEAWQSATGVKK